ncbi:hypothetical protein GOODEAATRI_024838 [Goodea atripinnis]|uniref:Uncharacterized protein n=1 Tax=Goodea atripinnis TaxID=208336 RepID=A0ABV0PRE2_9TELE
MLSPIRDLIRAVTLSLFMIIELYRVPVRARSRNSEAWTVSRDDVSKDMEAGRGVGTWMAGGGNEGKDLQSGLEAGDEEVGCLEASDEGAGAWPPCGS